SSLSGLQNFRSEGNDSHEVVFTQLTSNWSEDTRSTWSFIVTDDDASIFVKLDVGTICTTGSCFRTYDYGTNDLTFFDNATWCCVFNCYHDFITNTGILTA